MIDKDYRTELQVSIQHILIYVIASLFIAIIVFFALDKTSLPLVLITLGICVGGYKISQESTRPPNWLPLNREADQVGNNNIRNFISQKAVKPIRIKMARIAIVAAVFSGLLTIACLAFQPFAPNVDLFVLVVALLACFIVGVTIATSICWLVGYRAIIATL